MAFDPGLAAGAAGVPEADALRALDELLAQTLVRPARSARRFAFRHPVVRHAVYEGAPGGWRLAAHARAAPARTEPRRWGWRADASWCGEAVRASVDFIGLTPTNSTLGDPAAGGTAPHLLTQRS